VREPLIVLEASLRVVSANESFRRTFEVSREETEHQYFYELGNGQWNIPQLTTLLENVVRENRTFQDFRIEHNFPSIGTRVMLINAKGIVREGKPSYILLAIEDVTDRRP
jgi:PAS domain-containing protein